MDAPSRVGALAATRRRLIAIAVGIGAFGAGVTFLVGFALTFVGRGHSTCVGSRHTAIELWPPRVLCPDAIAEIGGTGVRIGTQELLSGIGFAGAIFLTIAVSVFVALERARAVDRG